MQLELFDIQTDNAGRKGKPGKATGKAGIVAAGQKTGADDASGPDFLAALRLVSEKSLVKSEDRPAAAAGLDPAVRDSQPIRLGDVLNEIIREWPAGRRPVDTIGAGGDRSKTTVSGSTPTKSDGKVAVTSDSAVAVLETGNLRHSLGRAKEGLDGFTTALIKRLSRAQSPKATPPIAGPDTAKTAETPEATYGARVSQGLSTDKPGKGDGFRILNLKNAKTDQNAPIAGHPHKAAANQKVGINTETTVDRSTAADVTIDLHPRVGQTVTKIKATAIKGEPHTARETETAQPGSRVNRSVTDGFSGKTEVVKSAAGRAELPKAAVVNNDQPSAAKPGTAFDVSKPAQGHRPAETVAANQAAPAAKRKPAIWGAKHTATTVSAPDKPQMDAGKSGPESALSSTRTKVDTARGMPGGNSKNAGPASPHLRHRPAEGMPNLKTGKTEMKTAAANSSKAAGRTEFPAADRDIFSPDGASGQATREARGGEQAKIEIADAKIKLSEPAAATSKTQPATSSTAAPEPAKSALDRVTAARVLEQISARIRLQPKNGAHEIRIQLRPETLGQMQLKVLAQDQAISVKMVAESAMARDIIENNIGQLRADLHALGLNVEKLDVDVLATGDPAEKDAAGQRGGFNKHGRGAAQQGGRDNEPADERDRPTPAVEDEAEEGTLVGVFA